MKTSYDQETDSLYIHFADHESVESVELANGLVMDYDLNGVEVGIDIQHASQKTDRDETLHIRLADKPIFREVSQDWHTHISYAQDGTIVEIVVLVEENNKENRHP